MQYKCFNVTSYWYYIVYIMTKNYYFTIFVLNIIQNNYVPIKLLFILIWNIIHYYFICLEILPDAIKTLCSKCNATQKNAALRVIERLQTQYSKEWQELLDKWDPKRELTTKFEEYMKAEKKKGFTKF